MSKSSIYTKTGDKGTTALVGGTRVKKNHCRLNAYGTIDELNSFVGWLACAIERNETLETIAFIQHKLFSVGGYLATEEGEGDDKHNTATIIKEEHIIVLEKAMDELDSNLPKINKFILPGGTEAASRANICRSVCRRAERLIYEMAEQYHVDQNILIFINRLSDYFFLLGRNLNNDDFDKENKSKEVFWNQKL